MGVSVRTTGAWAKRPAPEILDRQRRERPPGGYFCGKHRIRGEGDVSGCPVCRQDRLATAYRRLVDEVRVVLDCEPLSRETAETLRGHLVQASSALSMAKSDRREKPWSVRRPGAADVAFQTEREAIGFIELSFRVAAEKLPEITLLERGKAVAFYSAELSTERDDA